MNKRYSILGFNQERVCNLCAVVGQKDNGDDIVFRLDTTDLLILNHISDFPNRSKIIKYIDGNSVYFWVSYEELLNELPILGIKKQALADRFKKYVALHLVKQKMVALDAKHQNSTFFCLTEVYESLLYEKEGCGSQLQDGMVVNYYMGYSSQLQDNNNNKDNNNITKNNKEKDNKLSSKKAKEFIPPTVEEVKAYIKERGYHFDAKSFVEYYEVDEWHYGKGNNRRKVSNWKRCCTTWENTWKENHGGGDLFEQVENNRREELLLKRFYDILGSEEAVIYGIDPNVWYTMDEKAKNYHRAQPQKKEKLLKWIREHDNG
jgi:hypothetical protein